MNEGLSMTGHLDGGAGRSEYLEAGNACDGVLSDAVLVRKAMTPIEVMGSGTCGEAICALGVFDGVHRGHRFLIEQAMAQARREDLPSVIVTFDIDPDELFLPRDQVHKVLSNEDRLRLLASLGASQVLVIPFDRTFAAYSPRAFLEEVCSHTITARGIHVGSDFHFGFKAAGSVADIRAWGATAACSVHPHDLLGERGTPVTATRIRTLLAGGSLAQANILLGRPHFIRARVERGRGVGHGLGVPTANLAIDLPYTPIADGVYGGYLVVGDDIYRTAISVGAPSTFGETRRTIEAFLLDFEGDIYGRDVKAFFVEYLRPMRTFDSADDLVATVNSNITWVRENLPICS